MESRSEIANGPAIAALRREKGWTVADLCEKTGMTRRTIQRVQGCHPVDMATLRSVAEALGVEYQSLILRDPVSTEPAPGPKRSLKLIFNMSAEDFDANRDLPAIIDTLRSLTPKYFSATPGRKGPHLAITVEMEESDIDDIIGGSPAWMDEFDDLRGVEIDGELTFGKP